MSARYCSYSFTPGSIAGGFQFKNIKRYLFEGNFNRQTKSADEHKNFNYEMNADGTIARVTATSAGTVSMLTYQYQCN